MFSFHLIAAWLTAALSEEGHDVAPPPRGRGQPATAAAEPRPRRPAAPRRDLVAVERRRRRQS